MSDPNEPIIGHGKKLSWSDTIDGTYVQIKKTIEVQLPERELGASETTNDDSPDFHKEYIPGLKEPGSVPFTYRYTAAGFDEVEELFALADAVETRPEATKFWKCEVPDGAVARWRGFITKNDLPIEGEDSPIVEAEMKVTGKLTWDPPAEES